MICIQLRLGLGHLKLHIGDSLWRSEEIVKNLKLHLSMSLLLSLSLEVEKNGTFLLSKTRRNKPSRTEKNNTRPSQMLSCVALKEWQEPHRDYPPKARTLLNDNDIEFTPKHSLLGWYWGNTEGGRGEGVAIGRRNREGEKLHWQWRVHHNPKYRNNCLLVGARIARW